jgi:hypothetical protein
MQLGLSHGLKGRRDSTHRWMNRGAQTIPIVAFDAPAHFGNITDMPALRRKALTSSGGNEFTHQLVRSNGKWNSLSIEIKRIPVIERPFGCRI